MKGVGADAPYWAALKRGRLELPRCVICSTWRWPAPFRCAGCGGWSFEWTDVELSGRIYSWTRTWHPFAGTEALGHPYITASVELPQAGGVRLFGLLNSDDAPVIGANVLGVVAVTTVFEQVTPAIRWRLAA